MDRTQLENNLPLMKFKAIDAAVFSSQLSNEIWTTVAFVP